MDPVTLDLDALRRGDAVAVGAFYRAHARTVLGWVIRLGGPRLDAEDVAHEVFEAALKRLATFRGDASVSTWLYAVTRRVVANARRRVWVRRVFGLDQAPEPAAAPEGEARRMRRDVQVCLEALSTEQREVLVLLHLEERPAAEVAALLGVPIGTVYSRAFHARRVFAEVAARAGLLEGQGAIVIPLEGRR